MMVHKRDRVQFWSVKTWCAAVILFIKKNGELENWNWKNGEFDPDKISLGNENKQFSGVTEPMYRLKLKHWCAAAVLLF